MDDVSKEKIKTKGIRARAGVAKMSVKMREPRWLQTCQVSRNFRESPEMEHDLQVSRKCYKISRNLGSLINLIFFCKKACFWCESGRILV